jgi:hypothetical protein
MKEDDMGGTHSTHKSEEKYIEILVGISKGKRPLGSLSVDGKIVFKRFLGK